jgi:integrase
MWCRRAYIALHTAMRAGEILSLRREFIDLDKLLIHLPRAKTGARDVPISANLKQFLQRYLQSLAGDEKWLFASSASKSGHPRTSPSRGIELSKPQA